MFIRSRQAASEKFDAAKEAESTTKAKLKEMQAAVKAERAARDALVSEHEELVRAWFVCPHRCRWSVWMWSVLP